MQKYNTIEITLKNGETVQWGAEQWDDYDYGSQMFTIKKDGSLVAAYALDCVASILMKDAAGSFFRENRTLGIGTPTIAIGTPTICFGPGPSYAGR